MNEQTEASNILNTLAQFNNPRDYQDSFDALNYLFEYVPTRKSAEVEYELVRQVA